jgi:hypothetical protein
MNSTVFIGDRIERRVHTEHTAATKVRRAKHERDRK